MQATAATVQAFCPATRGAPRLAGRQASSLRLVQQQQQQQRQMVVLRALGGEWLAAAAAAERRQPVADSAAALQPELTSAICTNYLQHQSLTYQHPSIRTACEATAPG